LLWPPLAARKAEMHLPRRAVSMGDILSYYTTR